MDTNVISREVKEALLESTFIETDGLFTQEVHLFMHCHLKGYDRTGEGLHNDRGFFDKYGAPLSIEDYWMEGYHIMDRMLHHHRLKVGNSMGIPFPPVAGYVGTAHLYKVSIYRFICKIKVRTGNKI